MSARPSPRPGPRIGALVALCTWLLCSPLLAGLAHGETRAENATTGTISVSPSTVGPGTSVFVSGGDWPTGTQVSVQVCGANALRSSVDCDLVSSTVVGTTAVGSFGTQLTVQVPPAPCPCVVQVAAIGGGPRATLPVQIVGAPTAPLPDKPSGVPSKRVAIRSLRLEGGSWTAWLGAAPKRTLVLDVQNTSNTAIDEPLLVVYTGRGAGAEVPQPVREQAPLAAGAHRVIRMRVSFPAPAFGDYDVRVRVGESGSTVAARADMSSYPWGLFILLLLIVQAVLLLLRNRARRRLADKEAASEAAATSRAPTPETAPSAPPPVSWRVDQPSP